VKFATSFQLQLNTKLNQSKELKIKITSRLETINSFGGGEILVKSGQISKEKVDTKDCICGRISTLQHVNSK